MDRAEIRRLVEERLALAEKANPPPWRLAICCDEWGEDESRARIRSGNRDVASATNEDAEFLEHAGTHDRDLMRAILALLDADQSTPPTPGARATESAQPAPERKSP